MSPGKSHLQGANAELVSEVELLTELADRLLGETPINWRKLQDTRYVRELITKTIPGYQQIEKIDETKEEFTIEGRIFTEPKFATPSQKAQMFVTPLPKLSLPTKTDFGLPEMFQELS
jgi:hypothetical protein